MLKKRILIYKYTNLNNEKTNFLKRNQLYPFCDTNNYLDSNLEDANQIIQKQYSLIITCNVCGNPFSKAAEFFQNDQVDDNSEELLQEINKIWFQNHGEIMCVAGHSFPIDLREIKTITEP